MFLVEVSTVSCVRVAKIDIICKKKNIYTCFNPSLIVCNFAMFLILPKGLLKFWLMNYYIFLRVNC